LGRRKLAPEKFEVEQREIVIWRGAFARGKSGGGILVQWMLSLAAEQAAKFVCVR